MVSLPFTGGRRNRKQVIDVEVAFDNDDGFTPDRHGGTLVLYARKKRSDSWTTIRTIDTVAETEGVVTVSVQEMGELGSFQQLELKLRLTPVSETGNKKSPLVTSVIMRYDDGLQPKT